MPKGKERMKTLAIVLAGSLILAAPVAPALAQASPAITVGMQVTDANGGPVGTVTSIQGDNLVVKTDKHEVMLGKASFTPVDGKLLFGMTQAQLNAEIEKSAAAADASVIAGASVKGSDGAVLGTIDSVDAESVTMKVASGQLVKLSRTSVRGNADGTVTTGLTAEQLQSQLGAAAATAPTTGN
jgi:hypothetical protein